MRNEGDENCGEREGKGWKEEGKVKKERKVKEKWQGMGG